MQQIRIEQILNFNANAIASTLTGYTSGAGTISSSDTLIQAIQKLNGNITSTVSGVGSVFGRTGTILATSGDYNTSLVTESGNLYYTNSRGIGSTLTGYSSSVGIISSSDSILSAIQKLNGNLGNYLPLTGGTLSGDVQQPTFPISDNSVITRGYLYNNTNIISSIVHAATSSNVRNDQSCIIRLTNNRLLIAYSHFGNSVVDTSTCTIWAAFSDNSGTTWGTPFKLVDIGSDPANYTEIPSFYIKGNGNVILTYFIRGVTTLTSALYCTEYSADMSSIVIGPTQILDFTGYKVVASDRLLKDSHNNLLYPYAFLLSGTGSSTQSVFQGKMLVSANEGATWVDSGITIAGVLGTGGYTAFGGVIEPGIYESPKQGLVFYYRTLLGSVYANSLTFTSGTTYTASAAFNTYLGSMNSASAIKYWSTKNMLVATAIRFIGTDATIQANRLNIDVSLSNTGLDWNVVQNTAYIASGLVVNEPNIFIDPLTGNLINSYSVTDSINTQYNLHSTVLPSAHITSTFGIKQPASGGTGVNNGNYTIQLGGSITTGGVLTTTPNNDVILTTTGSTNITLPTSGIIPAIQTAATFSSLIGGGVGPLSAMNSIGASAAFIPTLGAYTLTGQAGIEATVHNGTNNYRVALIVNDTDAVWGLNLGYSSASIPFKIRSNVTDWLTITVGVFNIPNLTASSAVATDSSKNLVSVTNTGTGNNVLASSPTLVTPILGVAAATSVNKVTITTPTSSATLTLVTGSTLTLNGAFNTQFTGSANATFTLPGASQTLASLAGTETFTNKTLTSPVINVGSDATGDVYYRNAGVLTRIAIPAVGNFLSSTGTIPAYTAFSSLTSGDLIYWNGSNWANRNITVTGQYTWNSSTATLTNKGHSIFTPTTGGTVTLVNNKENIINPAGAIAAITLALPASPSNNDIIDLTFTQSVTTISYSGGTVLGGLTTILQGGQYHLIYDTATTTWY